MHFTPHLHVTEYPVGASFVDTSTPSYCRPRRKVSSASISPGLHSSWMWVTSGLQSNTCRFSPTSYHIHADRESENAKGRRTRRSREFGPRFKILFYFILSSRLFGFWSRYYPRNCNSAPLFSRDLYYDVPYYFVGCTQCMYQHTIFSKWTSFPSPAMTQAWHIRYANAQFTKEKRQKKREFGEITAGIFFVFFAFFDSASLLINAKRKSANPRFEAHAGLFHRWRIPASLGYFVPTHEAFLGRRFENRG